MPKKSPESPRPPIPAELLDELMAQCESPGLLLGNNGLLRQLSGALLQRALQAEITHHLGYEAREKKPDGATNERHA